MRLSGSDFVNFFVHSRKDYHSPRWIFGRGRVLKEQLYLTDDLEELKTLNDEVTAQDDHLQHLVSSIWLNTLHSLPSVRQRPSEDKINQINKSLIYY